MQVAQQIAGGSPRVFGAPLDSNSTREAPVKSSNAMHGCHIMKENEVLSTEAVGWSCSKLATQGVATEMVQRFNQQSWPGRHAPLLETDACPRRSLSRSPPQAF